MRRARPVAHLPRLPVIRAIHVALLELVIFDSSDRVHCLLEPEWRVPRIILAVLDVHSLLHDLLPRALVVLESILFNLRDGNVLGFPCTDVDSVARVSGRKFLFQLIRYHVELEAELVELELLVLVLRVEFLLSEDL